MESVERTEEALEAVVVVPAPGVKEKPPPGLKPPANPVEPEGVVALAVEAL